MKITVKQIAASAKVSVGTVSHVINGSAAVSDTVRQRVEDVIRKLDYHPSQLARGLRKRSTDLLGIIIPDITNPFFPRIVRGIEDVSYHAGLRLILCNTDNNAKKEASYLNDLLSFQPAGILVIPAEGSTLGRQGPHSNIKMIFVDRCPSWWKGDSVVANNEEGGYQAGRYAAEMGHTAIAAVAGPSHTETARDRMRGLQKALSELGIALPPHYIIESSFTKESGHSAGLRLLKMQPRPTAIFACSDTVAYGVLAAVRELKLRCPEDVSIIGFDDLESSELTQPALTTIYQPGYQLGALACQLLLDRVRGAEHPPERKVLSTELRVRDSVRPPADLRKRTRRQPAKR